MIEPGFGFGCSVGGVCACDEAGLQQELRRLMQAELVYRKGFGAQARYLFKHALVRDAAYESLLKRERQQIHRRIAETLASRFPAIAETTPEILAHHYTEAGLTEPAIDFWLRAGGRTPGDGLRQPHAVGAARVRPRGALLRAARGVLPPVTSTAHTQRRLRGLAGLVS